MTQRREFVLLANVSDANLSQCATAWHQPKTVTNGAQGFNCNCSKLADRSRRPHRSPRRTFSEHRRQCSPLLRAPGLGGRKLRPGSCSRHSSVPPPVPSPRFCIGTTESRLKVIAPSKLSTFRAPRTERPLANGFQSYFATAPGVVTPYRAG